MNEKKRARESARQFRDGLGEEERRRADAVIAQRFLSLEQVRSARCISIYVSTGSEVDTTEIIEQLWTLGKQVYVPLCEAHGKMDFYKIDSWRELSPGRYGIREPKQPLGTPLERPELIVVPALAFDRNGHRVGYGGGYYDRYLQRFPHTVAVGLCHSACMHTQVPKEPHDRSVMQVITEK